ncbi:MAG: lysylphosphatidylglycerol synthase transmembrane domain-containing protein [Bacteroidetes bacterium]|nr:lysylphosphatidylglycerol synthase transmembrane domain-containing protein [Bacteroidota bacterium]
MKDQLKKYIKLFLSILLSGVILWLIYRKMDFVQLAATFRQIRLLPALVFLLSFIPQFFLATVRWKVMVRRIGGVTQTFYKSFQQVVGSYSANLVIPGKMGEFVRIPWMRKLPLNTPVLILVMLEKSLDLLAVIMNLFIFLVVYIMLTDNNLSILNLITLILGLFIMTVVLLYYFRKGISSWIEKRFKGYLNKKSGDFFYFRWKQVIGHFDQHIQWYLLISILLWLVQGFEFFIIFWMFGIRISLVNVYTGCFLALLAGALPVSIAGLGPRDAVIITFFKGAASYATLAGVGLMSLFRIIIAALVGLPFFFIQTKES